MPEGLLFFLYLVVVGSALVSPRWSKRGDGLTRGDVRDEETVSILRASGTLPEE